MLFSHIISYADYHQLIPNDKKIIVGLSGGPDSVFLLYFLKQLAEQRSLTLVAAHLDHEWRKDSYKDGQLCVTLCQQWSIPLVIKKASDLLMKPFSGTPEQKGRAQRRFFFEQLLREHNADLIALAHHEQDQQETFFIRLIRGATLSGLASMRPKAGVYIRPLLQTSKEALLVYLHEHNIAYCIDPTNQDEAMLRNRIRKQVLPALVACDNRFAHNFMRTITSLQETELFLELLTEKTLSSISMETDGILYVNVAQFLALDVYMQQRILMQLLIKNKIPFVPTHNLLAEIIRFLNNKGVKHTLSDAWMVAKKKGSFFVTKL